MDVFLLFENKAYNPHQELAPQTASCQTDLKIDIILQYMAAGDTFLRENIRPLLYNALPDSQSIFYRQAVLRDCLQNSQAIRAFYSFVSDALIEKTPHYLFFGSNPERVLENAVRDLEGFLPFLHRLNDLSAQLAPHCTAPAWQRFWQMLDDELTPEYLQEMAVFLQELHFPHGLLVKAQLDLSLKPKHYDLCTALPRKEGGILSHISHLFHSDATHLITIPDRDENGFRILSELRSRAVAALARTVAQARDCVHDFFLALKTELSFYVGALNLADKLALGNHCYCFPTTTDDAAQHPFSAKGLYCATLALQANQQIITNDFCADGQLLTLLCGPNQGGKTTFLLAIGQAQMMLNCGLFVAAQSLKGMIMPVFTHFKREEDNKLSSGKFEEELSRMSRIIDYLHPNSLILMNESFSATNEQEGSQIALELLAGLKARQVRVIFVTHFHYLASTLYDEACPAYGFYSAQRLKDGTRTYKIEPHAPDISAFGDDLYKKIFQK